MSQHLSTQRGKKANEEVENEMDVKEAMEE